MEISNLRDAFSILEENYDLNSLSIDTLQLVLIKEFEVSIEKEKIQKEYELFRKRY